MGVSIVAVLLILPLFCLFGAAVLRIAAWLANRLIPAPPAEQAAEEFAETDRTTAEPPPLRAPSDNPYAAPVSNISGAVGPQSETPGWLRSVGIIVVYWGLSSILSRLLALALTPLAPALYPAASLIWQPLLFVVLVRHMAPTRTYAHALVILLLMVGLLLPILIAVSIFTFNANSL